MVSKDWIRSISALAATPLYLMTSLVTNRTAEIFGGVNVCWIVELKVIGKIKFGKLIDFGNKQVVLPKIWLV